MQLGSLPVATYFETYAVMTDEVVVRGFLMGVTHLGRCLVNLTAEGPGNRTSIGNGSSERIYDLKKQQSWAYETPVVDLGVDEDVLATITEYKGDEGMTEYERLLRRMTPQQRALQKMWTLHCISLAQLAIKHGEQGSGGTADSPDVSRKRNTLYDHINRVAREAEEAKMFGMLPLPPVEVEEDSVFFGLDDYVQMNEMKMPRLRADDTLEKLAMAANQRGGAGISGRVSTVRATVSIPPSQLTSDVEDEEEQEEDMALGQKKPVAPVEAANEAVAQPEAQAQPTTTAPANAAGTAARPVASKAEKAKAKAAAAKAAGQPAPPKPKKEKVFGPCLDGCGEQVTGRFKMGHDAKLKSLLMKVERGELDQTAIPEPAQPYVKVKKGGMEVQKVEGKDVRIQTYQLTKAPVRIPGRTDVEYVEKLDDGR